MEQITFTKNQATGEWEGEFICNASVCHVQLKRTDAGSILIQQKGFANGDWNTRETQPYEVKNPNFNLESKFFPMHWKVISGTQVTDAYKEDMN